MRKCVVSNICFLTASINYLVYCTVNCSKLCFGIVYFIKRLVSHVMWVILFYFLFILSLFCINLLLFLFLIFCCNILNCVFGRF